MSAARSDAIIAYLLTPASQPCGPRELVREYDAAVAAWERGASVDLVDDAWRSVLALFCGAESKARAFVAQVRLAGFPHNAEKDEP